MVFPTDIRFSRIRFKVAHMAERDTGASGTCACWFYTFTVVVHMANVIKLLTVVVEERVVTLLVALLPVFAFCRLLAGFAP